MNNRYIRLFWSDTLYYIGIIIFWFKLYNLNIQLRNELLYKNSFEVLQYQEYLPIKFFFFSLLFGFFAFLIFCDKIKKILRNSYEIDVIITIFFSLLLLIISVIITWILINNPILRMILVAMSTVGGIILYSER